jgi:hypothetical protein
MITIVSAISHISANENSTLRALSNQIRELD